MRNMIMNLYVRIVIILRDNAVVAIRVMIIRVSAVIRVGRIHANVAQHVDMLLALVVPVVIVIRANVVILAGMRLVGAAVHVMIIPVSAVILVVHILVIVIKNGNKKSFPIRKAFFHI